MSASFTPGATKEPGEPDHAGAPGGKSIWFRWSAPASGGVVFETEGSAAETILAAYAGDGFDTLTQVAADRDSSASGRSRLIFGAIAGHVYAIALDDPAGLGGAVLLTWDLEAGDAVPRITSGARSFVSTNLATFTFDSAPAGGPFRCALDGAAPSACQSPLQLTNLDDAPHVFAVYAGGNAEPARRAFTVDTSAPSIGLEEPAPGLYQNGERVVSGGQVVIAVGPTLELRATGRDDESGIGELCLLVDGVPQKCGPGPTISFTYQVPPGAQQLAVAARATNRAGMTRTTPEVAVIAIDTN
jgi:hypothetical protein